MKHSAFFLTFLFSLLQCSVTMAQDQKIPDSTPEIERRCLMETKEKCIVGDCFDGFATTCYYDKLNHSTQPKFFKDQTVCFADHHRSICKPCANEFKIKVNGSMKDVSCQEFYQVLSKKNKGCRGCIAETGSYGG